MTRYLRTAALVLLLCAISVSMAFPEQATITKAQEAISDIADAPSMERRYEAAHRLADQPAAEIAEALNELKVAEHAPATLVAIMSAAVPKAVVTRFEDMWLAVMRSPDTQAKIGMLDMLAWSTPMSVWNNIVNVVYKHRELDMQPVEIVHYQRCIWMLFTFFGSQFALEQDNFQLPKFFQTPVRGIFDNAAVSETLQADAAITLAEMGVSEDGVMAMVRRFANDPTDLGRRARSVLMGHPIYDEVVRRAMIMHPDVDKLDARTFAINAGKGVASGLDAHSTFFDPDAVKSWGESRSGEYGGIGAYVSARDGVYSITRPFYNGPAYKAGLRSGDRIVGVEGEMLTGNDIDDLVRRLKGTPGTPVKIKVFRRGWSSIREFTLIRAQINVPNIHTAQLPGNVAYIRLDSFSEKARDQMVAAMRTISAWEPKGLVFDLRGNPGGGLHTAVDVVSMFMDANKLAVYEQGRPEVYERNNHFTSNRFKTFTKPLVILTNDFSASASEIVSGALKHYGRATLVGQTTYGKGSVQIVMWLSRSDFTCQLKLTIAKYYLPNDVCIHGIGVAPDIEVKPAEIQGWVFDEAVKLRESGVINAYIEKLIAADKKLAEKLATNDYADHTRYPGFDEWAAGVKTILSPSDLRFVLQEELRRVVQDERGEEFACDPANDVQLQTGLLAVLRKAGLEPEKMEEVAPFTVLEQQRIAEQKAAEEKEKGVIGK